MLMVWCCVLLQVRFTNIVSGGGLCGGGGVCIYMCVFVYVDIHTRDVCACVCVHACTCMHVCVCVCVRACVCVCVHTHTCVCLSSAFLSIRMRKEDIVHSQVRRLCPFSM